MRPRLVLVIISLTFYFSGCGLSIKSKAKVVKVKNDIQQIQEAIKDYNINYGGEISGTSAEIVKALMGANPRKVVYLETSPKQIGADGSFLDAWGTPYRVTLIPTQFAAPSAIQVSSAGPDRVFDTADDISTTKTPR